MKELVIRAIEREVGSQEARVKLPLIHLKSGRKLELREFDFDDLLA